MDRRNSGLPHLMESLGNNRAGSIYDSGSEEIMGPDGDHGPPPSYAIPQGLLSADQLMLLADGSGGQELGHGGSRRCNCKKAKCLKLYCVCFAAGLYCSGCPCRECQNTLIFSDVVLTERQKILERNPNAFAPKVQIKGRGDVTHKKGCRCRKSRCLKKYCECFDACVPCSFNCRCDDCHNQPEGGLALQLTLPHSFGTLSSDGLATSKTKRPSEGFVSQRPSSTPLPLPSAMSLSDQTKPDAWNWEAGKLGIWPELVIAGGGAGEQARRPNSTPPSLPHEGEAATGGHVKVMQLFKPNPVMPNAAVAATTAVLTSAVTNTCLPSRCSITDSATAPWLPPSCTGAPTSQGGFAHEQQQQGQAGCVPQQSQQDASVPPVLPAEILQSSSVDWMAALGSTGLFGQSHQSLGGADDLAAADLRDQHPDPEMFLQPASLLANPQYAAQLAACLGLDEARQMVAQKSAQILKTLLQFANESRLSTAPSLEPSVQHLPSESMMMQSDQISEQLMRIPLSAVQDAGTRGARSSGNGAAFGLPPISRAAAVSCRSACSLPAGNMPVTTFGGHQVMHGFVGATSAAGSADGRERRQSSNGVGMVQLGSGSFGFEGENGAGATAAVREKENSARQRRSSAGVCIEQLGSGTFRFGGSQGGVPLKRTSTDSAPLSDGCRGDRSLHRSDSGGGGGGMSLASKGAPPAASGPTGLVSFDSAFEVDQYTDACLQHMHPQSMPHMPNATNGYGTHAHYLGHHTHGHHHAQGSGRPRATSLPPPTLPSLGSGGAPQLSDSTLHGCTSQPLHRSNYQYLQQQHREAHGDGSHSGGTKRPRVGHQGSDGYGHSSYGTRHQVAGKQGGKAATVHQIDPLDSQNEMDALQALFDLKSAP